jgi:hypothetical protein
MVEEEDIAASAAGEDDGTSRSVFRGARRERVSPFRKKEVGGEVSYTSKTLQF